METILPILCGLLAAASIYLMLSGNLIRFIFGLVLATNAVNLIIFIAGGISDNVPPLIPEGKSALTEPAANALPQALILTAIVIGFALLTFIFILFYKSYQALGTVETESMRVSEPEDLYQNHYRQGILTAFLMLAGGFFCLVASIGMLRLPDIIIRMHAATKAGAFGGGLMFLALAAFYMDVSTSLRSLAAVFFLLLTAPVAAHLIGRAAYCTSVRLSENTRIDELANVCDWCQQQSFCEIDLNAQGVQPHKTTFDNSSVK